MTFGAVYFCVVLLAQARTVQGYRAAIGAVHHGLPGGFNISSSPILTQLIKGMFHLHPLVRRLILSWDLPLVLQYLGTPGMRSLHKLIFAPAFTTDSFSDCCRDVEGRGRRYTRFPSGINLCSLWMSVCLFLPCRAGFLA